MLREVNWMTSMRIPTGNDRYINLKKEENIYMGQLGTVCTPLGPRETRL